MIKCIHRHNRTERIMGYCYAIRNGRHILACDSCGTAGNVRKRRCIYGWCQPPALCGPCYATLKPTLHGDACRISAEQYQAEKDAEQAILDGGDAISRTGWGSWHDAVPDGYVGRRFEYGDGTSAYRLIPADIDNDRTSKALSDYPEAIDWTNHPGTTTKEVTVR